MKKYLMLLASVMMLGAFSSCSKEENNKKEPATPPVEKSTECKLLSFDVKGEGIDIKGDVYEQEKVVELLYLPEQADAMKNLAATYTVSEKATISPDPATVKDYSAEQKFTVTAEDGKTKAEYTVMGQVAKFDVSLKPGKVIDLKNAFDGDLVKIDGNMIGFCSPNMLALPSMEAISLDGSKKEKINTEGIPAGYCIQGMGNDDNGYLVVCFGYGDNNYGGKTPAFLAEILSMQIWIWKDGYQKAPTKIYENPAAVGAFLTVGGDFNKSMICCGKPYGSRNGVSHLWMWKDGNTKVESGAWQWVVGDPRESIKTNTKENEHAEAPYWWNGSGNSAGEMMNFIDGTKEGKLLWSCADDKCLWDKEKNAFVSAGGAVYVRDGAGTGKTEGYSVEDANMHMNANTFKVGAAAKPRYAGKWGYGNIAATPKIKGFKYNGEYYAAAASTAWTMAYFTIMNISKSTKTETNTLLDSQKIDEFGGPLASSTAYVYDPETDTGHVVFMQKKKEGKEGKLYCYDLVRKKL